MSSPVAELALRGTRDERQISRSLLISPKLLTSWSLRILHYLSLLSPLYLFLYSPITCRLTPISIARSPIAFLPVDRRLPTRLSPLVLRDMISPCHSNGCGNRRTLGT